MKSDLGMEADYEHEVAPGIFAKGKPAKDTEKSTDLSPVFSTPEKPEAIPDLTNTAPGGGGEGGKNQVTLANTRQKLFTALREAQHAAWELRMYRGPKGTKLHARLSEAAATARRKFEALAPKKTEEEKPSFEKVLFKFGERGRFKNDVLLAGCITLPLRVPVNLNYDHARTVGFADLREGNDGEVIAAVRVHQELLALHEWNFGMGYVPKVFTTETSGKEEFRMISKLEVKQLAIQDTGKR